MDGDRLAPLLGIVGCLGVLGALVFPYVAAEGAVGAYYGSGAVNPLVVGVLALVTIIVLAAGRERRTDPELAAGAALVFGVFMFAMALAWSLTARVDAVIISQNHRTVMAGVSLLVPVGSLWYALSLDLI